MSGQLVKLCRHCCTAVSRMRIRVRDWPIALKRSLDMKRDPVQSVLEPVLGNDTCQDLVEGHARSLDAVRAVLVRHAGNAKRLVTLAEAGWEGRVRASELGSGQCGPPRIDKFCEIAAARSDAVQQYDEYPGVHVGHFRGLCIILRAREFDRRRSL